MVTVLAKYNCNKSTIVLTILSIVNMDFQPELPLLLHKDLQDRFSDSSRVSDLRD